MADYEDAFQPEEEMEGMDDLVIFENEDGEEFTYGIVDYFFYNGDEYALLAEITEDEEEDERGTACIICKIETTEDENGEENEEFVPVEDEELADRLFEVATTKLSEEEEGEE